MGVSGLMDLICAVRRGCRDHSSSGVFEMRADSLGSGKVRVRGGSLRNGGVVRGIVKGRGHCECVGSELYVDRALVK